MSTEVLLVSNVLILINSSSLRKEQERIKETNFHFNFGSDGINSPNQGLLRK